MSRQGKLKWDNFIHGRGLERVRDAVEYMKKILYKKYFNRNRTPKNLILAIRMEHLQLKKHQKLAMRYLQELEERIIQYENILHR